MRSVASIASLIFVSLLALAPTCGAPTAPLIYSPSGDVVEFSFGVQVQLPPNSSFDPGTGVTLNGVALPVTGGPGVFEATVNPGLPLQDVNTLTVSCVLSNGTPSSATRTFAYAPPKARVRQITNPADLIQGPLAHGRVGDWLIENSVARFIVQDVAKRDMYSVGAFGGNLIDLELVSNPGNDNFIEIQPMLNVETVLNAQTVDVVNDGQDGTPAILQVCGPDDLLDFVNPSSQIGSSTPPAIDDNDQPVEACTQYTLKALEPWLRMDTTVMHTGPVTEPPLPPVKMFVGDWYNPGGQLEQWTRPLRMGEVTATSGTENPLRHISLFGYGEMEGVDYGYTTLPLDPPVMGAGVPSLVTQSGVLVVLHHVTAVSALQGTPAPFTVEPGENRTFSRYVSVGDGSGGNATDMEFAVKSLAGARIEGCVTVAGVPLAGSRVSVVRIQSGAINRMETNFVTEAGPCPNYGGRIPAGTAGGTLNAAAWRRGTPYEGGGSTPAFHPFAVSAGGTATVNIDLPATGRLSAHVIDENEVGIPARVSVIGFDPSPPITAPGPGLPGFGAARLGLFEDPKEALPLGIVAFGYTDSNGDVAFDVEPGTDEEYRLVVSRGTEYSIYEAPLTITAGSTTPVTAQIARVLDTQGFVSSDFHVHGIRSADSRVADGPRVAQFAGEGTENIIMTDHHVHTNLLPTIAALELGPWVTSTIGEEITTFDYGHFNGYPFTIDPARPSGGSTDWGKAAPPGMDFPSAGAFNATPAEIFALATEGAQATPDTTVQINHIDSHFAPMQIDTSVMGAISDGLDDAERLGRRLPSIASAGNLFHHFPALELWNGADRTQQNNFLVERIGIWMNHLNKGLRTTAISDTDTHTFGDLESAGARTWTASSTDSVPAISGGEVAQSVDLGRAVGGQGIYVQTRLLASGGVADLTKTGSTDVTSDGDVDLEIRVQAPTWARFDRIEIYANAATTPVNASAPYLFGATPNFTRLEGDCDPATTGDGDFDISIVNHPSVAGAARQEVTHTVSFTDLTEDTWFAVVVKGTDNVCPPMFPVYPRSLDPEVNTNLDELLDGNVGEGGTLALGVANALYADVDGEPGFQPPNP